MPYCSTGGVRAEISPQRTRGHRGLRIAARCHCISGDGGRDVDALRRTRGQACGDAPQWDARARRAMPCVLGDDVSRWRRFSSSGREDGATMSAASSEEIRAMRLRVLRGRSSIEEEAERHSLPELASMLRSTRAAMQALVEGWTQAQLRLPANGGGGRERGGSLVGDGGGDAPDRDAELVSAAYGAAAGQTRALRADAAWPGRSRAAGCGEGGVGGGAARGDGSAARRHRGDSRRMPIWRRAAIRRSSGS